MLLLLLGTSHAIAQNKEQRKQLKEIEGQWSVDDNNNLTYTKIVENLNLPKEEIYDRCLAFFSYAYEDAKDVIQLQNKEDGQIIAKGRFDNFENYLDFIASYVYSADHIIRIDTKDNRMRLILTVQEYEQLMEPNASAPSIKNRIPVHSAYPINTENPVNKKRFAKVFLTLHKVCLGMLDIIEKSVREGNTSSNVENNDDW